MPPVGACGATLGSWLGGWQKRNEPGTVNVFNRETWQQELVTKRTSQADDPPLSHARRLALEQATTTTASTGVDARWPPPSPSIQTPDAGGNWPLVFTVRNATVFSPEARRVSSEALFVTFVTDDGASYEQRAFALQGFGFTLLVVSFIGLWMVGCGWATVCRKSQQQMAAECRDRRDQQMAADRSDLQMQSIVPADLQMQRGYNVGGAGQPGVHASV